ncbi:phasin family protein [Paenibacillus pinistramenti]|uniref:phasin family protein n=1 Tax=Paenibacillus pinistramenti TaxID=1768003 RepID=UPI00193AB67E|nr:hypothetical protein [Paenibacillus pinistramenti]
MKDLFSRAVSLGLGVAAQSKEQIEKAVDELVKKGELTRSESSDVVNDLVAKGQEAKRNLEAMVNERVKKLTGAHNYVTKEQAEELLKRIEELELKVFGQTKEPLGSQGTASAEHADSPVQQAAEEQPKTDSQP